MASVARRGKSRFAPLKTRSRVSLSQLAVSSAGDGLGAQGRLDGFNGEIAQTTETDASAAPMSAGCPTCRDRDSFCPLHWATAAPSAKGLGAANLLIVAWLTP